MGTREGESTLADARRLRDLLERKGYVPGNRLLYVEDVGAGHPESAWAERFGKAVRLMLGGTRVEP